MQGQMKEMYPALKATFGMVDTTTNDEYKKSMTAVKDIVKTISTALGEGNWLAGSAEPTVCDFICAQLLSMCFQTMLDAGFCKAKINAAAGAWFKRVAALPAFIAVNGKMMVCEKAIKPLLVAEVKKAAPAKETPEEIAAKKAAKEAAKAEKPKDKIDALPETDFDLYSYKTFLVNEKDRAGVGMAKTKEMFQSEKFAEGFSFWYVKYEKYGDEGQVEYKFANLLGGFMQRIDPKLSRYAFARVLMLGDEPDLNIEGVFMFRGQEIPELMNDNPQFEYFEKKKLDFMGNEADYKLVGEFFAAPKEGGQVDNRNIKQQEWLK
jgi:elongation factor 1-gamma